MSRDRTLIALVTDSAVPSGVGEHMLTLARALSATHDVVLSFSAVGDGTRFLERAGSAGFGNFALEDLSQWLGQYHPEVLHVHAGIGWEGHSQVEAGWNAGVPVVRTEHLPYVLTDSDQKIGHRLAANLSETLVVVSDAAAESYRAAGFAGIVTIRNGIDTPIANVGREEKRAELSIPDQSTIVITVARFTAQKGYHCLIHAAAEVSRQVPRVIFLLVGDGPERETMQALATSLDLTNVCFLGERMDVPDLLGASDLFVLPSFFEGLPLVVLEAMALAVPVVATSIGGTVEALGDDHPFLVPAGEPAPLAAAIVSALEDQTASRVIGMKQRKRFEDRFTAARMGREMASLYRATSEKVRVA